MNFDMYEAVRKDAIEKNAALIQKLSREDSWIQLELLWFFWLLDSSIFFPKTRKHLALVADTTSDIVSKLVGVPVAKNIVHTHQKQLQYSGGNILGVSHSSPTPENMSELELEMYFNAYFNDAIARGVITKLFMRERAYQSYNSTLNLLTTRDDEKQKNTEKWTLHNTHSLGLTLESVWEEGRRFTLKYDYEKVRKKHKAQDALNTQDAEIVPFPITPKPHSEEAPLSGGESTNSQLVSNTVEMCEKVFISSMQHLSHLFENLEWFLWIRKKMFIPQEIATQLERLKEIEILEGLFNFHEHIESTLAAMIAYNSPSLVKSLWKERIEMIKKVEGEYYPKRQDIPLSPVTDKKEDTKKNENTVHLVMHPDVAIHYGFSVPAEIACSPKFIEHFFSLPDDNFVIFELEWRQVKITAKMFRKVFHRGSVPEKTTGDDNVIYPK